MAAQGPQLFRRNAVGAAGFHGEFLDPVHGEPGLNGRQQPVQLVRFQGGGGPAADIDGIQDPVFHQAGCFPDLPDQGVQIGVHPFPPGGDGERREGTVKTGGRTEGDAYVEAVSILIMNIRQDPPLPLRDVHCQQGLFPADPEFFFHIGSRLLRRRPRLHVLHGDLGRPDADQLAPGQALSGIGAEEIVEKVLQGRLAGRAFRRVAVPCRRPQRGGPVLFRDPDADAVLLVIYIDPGTSQILFLSGLLPCDHDPDILFRIEGLEQGMDLISV